MKNKIIFGVVCILSIYNLHGAYVCLKLDEPLEVAHEITLPQKWKGQGPITTGCFGQTGSTLALAVGKTVMLYIMGSKRDDQGDFLMRAPGQFLERFHFKFPVMSVALDEQTDSMYVSTTSVVSRVNWRTKLQQNIKMFQLAGPLKFIAGPLKFSPFQESIASVSSDSCSALYNGKTDKIIGCKEHEIAIKNMQPHFTWKLRDNPDGSLVIQSRVDILPQGTLCAIYPGAAYPIVKTGVSKTKEPQLVLVNSDEKESYRALSGTPISLVRSPSNPNQVVVGYQNGDAEIIDLTLFPITWKYEDIHPPFIFNPHGTVLVGTRDQKIVMIHTASSKEESTLIEQSLVLAGLEALEGQAALRRVLSCLQPIPEQEQKKEKKPKKSKHGGKKKKKNRRRKR